jgi:hypothetical protein
LLAEFDESLARLGDLDVCGQVIAPRGDLGDIRDLDVADVSDS